MNQYWKFFITFSENMMIIRGKQMLDKMWESVIVAVSMGQGIFESITSLQMQGHLWNADCQMQNMQFLTSKIDADIEASGDGYG